MSNFKAKHCIFPRPIDIVKTADLIYNFFCYYKINCRIIILIPHLAGQVSVDIIGACKIRFKNGAACFLPDIIVRGSYSRPADTANLRIIKMFYRACKPGPYRVGIIVQKSDYLTGRLLYSNIPFFGRSNLTCWYYFDSFVWDFCRMVRQKYNFKIRIFKFLAILEALVKISEKLEYPD